MKVILVLGVLGGVVVVLLVATALVNVVFSWIGLVQVTVWHVLLCAVATRLADTGIAALMRRVR